MSLPARSTLVIQEGILYPSTIGTTCVTPSPQSSTTPVYLATEYNESTAWVAKNIAGTFNDSKKKVAAFSRFLTGFYGA